MLNTAMPIIRITVAMDTGMVSQFPANTEPHRQRDQNQTNDPELPYPPLDGRRIAHISVKLFLLLLHDVFCLFCRPFHRGFAVKQPSEEAKHPRNQQQEQQPHNGEAVKHAISYVNNDVVDGVQNRGRREAKKNLFHTHSTSLSDGISVPHLCPPYKKKFPKDAQLREGGSTCQPATRFRFVWAATPSRPIPETTSTSAAMIGVGSCPVGGGS